MSCSHVHIGPSRLPGDLEIPDAPVTGLVIFAHGSGSSRLSPRNQFVARQLHARGLATLLFDLLTDEEARDRRNVFDIPLLALRLRWRALEWQQTRPKSQRLPAGSSAPAPVRRRRWWLRPHRPNAWRAVVSRGGRPDLAGTACHAYARRRC